MNPSEQIRFNYMALSDSTRTTYPKISAFTILFWPQINSTLNQCQILIVQPNDERVKQVERLMMDNSDKTSVKWHACSYGERDIKKDTQILISTPDIVCDLIDRKSFKLDDLKVLVMDDMYQVLPPLCASSKTKIQEIMQHLPSEKVQVVLTMSMPPISLEFMSLFCLQDPLTVFDKEEQLSIEGIRQFYIYVNAEKKNDGKFDILCEILNNSTQPRYVIFCKDKDPAEQITNKLRDKGISVTPIYGSLNQKECEKLIEPFKSGITRVLVITDFWARSVDLQFVSWVINYDFPAKSEHYFRRLCAGGRYDSERLVINLISLEERNKRKKKYCAIVRPSASSNSR